MLATTDAYEIAGIIATAMAVLGAVGGGIFIVIRGNYYTSTIDALKDNNEAFRDRISELERQNQEQAESMRRQTAAIDVLRETVSGTKAIEALRLDLHKKHDQLMQAVQARSA